MVPSPLEQAIELAGGISKAATAVNKSAQALRKWIDKGTLPRTEFTGETDYAEKLAAASGYKFTAEWLRQNAKPKTEAA
jgi:hypothetical protein